MLRTLGNIYFRTNDYSKSERAFQETLAIFEKSLGQENPKIVGILGDFAMVLVNKGDYVTAENHLLRGLAIVEKSASSNSNSLSTIVGNLGYLYVTKGEFARAEPYVRRGLAIREKQLGPDNPANAEDLENLAIILKEKKEYAEALQVAQRAAALKEKIVGADHIYLVAILNNVANIYKAQGEYEKACEAYLRILQIAEKSGGPNHRTTMTIVGNLANAYAAKGDIVNALKYQTRVDAVIENNIVMNLTLGSERQKLAYLDLMSPRTERTITFSVGLGVQEKEAKALAALVVLQRKGRALDAMANGLVKLRQRSNAEDQILLDRLNNVASQIARLTLNGPQKIFIEEHQQKIKTLEEQKEKLEGDISQRNTEFRTQTQAVTLATVQAAIPENAALLGFAVYRPFDPATQGNSSAYGNARYAVYLVRHDGSTEAKDLGEAAVINEAIVKLQEALRDPSRKDFRTLARVVDEKVTQPLRPLLGATKHLILSPDGALNLIPFEALVDEQNHFLIENYNLSYLSSGRDLLRLNVARNASSNPVIIADPYFGKPEQTQIAKTDTRRSKTNSRAQKRQSVTTANDLGTVYFAPLSATAPEANAIRAQFPYSLLLTGANATETALKQVTAPKILHIATHGFFLTDNSTEANAKDTRSINAKTKIENPLLRSGLALAGANLHKSDNEDGILTALEASGLNLWGTKLVTLSACDTGIGEVKNGEGVYGLRRAFVLAGTESLVMSLWPVSDYVTRELMMGYY